MKTNVREPCRGLHWLSSFYFSEIMMYSINDKTIYCLVSVICPKHHWKFCHWKWQNFQFQFSRNTASMSSPFISWAIYWILILALIGYSITRVNVMLSGQNHYLSQSYPKLSQLQTFCPSASSSPKYNCFFAILFSYIILRWIQSSWSMSFYQCWELMNEKILIFYLDSQIICSGTHLWAKLWWLSTLLLSSFQTIKSVIEHECLHKLVENQQCVWKFKLFFLLSRAQHMSLCKALLM